MKKITLTSLVLLLSFILSSQNTCLDAIPICNSNESVFPNNSNGTVADENVGFGCVFQQPNPTWFYIPVATSGDVDFQITQYRADNGNLSDADFVLWGPFSDVVCDANNLSELNIVDCSFSPSATENVFISNASPGQIYMLMVTNFSGPPGFIEFTETTNTNFFDSISCNGFRLRAFLDLNGNDIKDNDEILFLNGNLNYSINDGEDVVLNNSTGLYYLFDNNDQNSYDFEFVIDETVSPYFALETPLIENQIISESDITDFYFPIDIVNNYNDLAVSITPLDSPNPGFDTEQTVVLQNLGSSTIASGTITYTFDPLTSFISCSDPNYSLSDNVLTIPFTDIGPFETFEYNIILNTSPPPAVNINDILVFSAEVTAADIADINLENNLFNLSMVVVGSFDPNDKLDAHGGNLIFEDFTSEDFIYYTIRFQNTGTASAQRVVIKDLLNSELDVSTLVMLSSSHSYQLKIENQELEWEFRNINLPDSTNDEPNSHGYVSFKVKPTNGYTIDTIFENTAEIYFDFNEPIITNTMVTTFSSRLNINDVTQYNISLFPNPTKDKIFITSTQKLTHVIVTNLLGQTLKSIPINNLEAVLELDELPSGNYFVALHTDHTKVVKRIIKK
jgi:uncharacterized repeat protein (TIGR01451 family)